MTDQPLPPENLLVTITALAIVLVVGIVLHRWVLRPADRAMDHEIESVRDRGNLFRAICEDNMTDDELPWKRGERR